MSLLHPEHEPMPSQRKLCSGTGVKLLPEKPATMKVTSATAQPSKKPCSCGDSDCPWRACGSLPDREPEADDQEIAPMTPKSCNAPMYALCGCVTSIISPIAHRARPQHRRQAVAEERPVEHLGDERSPDVGDATALMPVAPSSAPMPRRYQTRPA
jgi:hypothetical protein